MHLSYLAAMKKIITMDFLKKTKEILKVWKIVKELITIRQRNDLPLTNLQIGKQLKLMQKK